MLTLRCAHCRTKLLRYNKLGKGEVVRCHRARIEKLLQAVEHDGKLWCPCGNPVGIDKGAHFRMIRKSFVYSGRKVSKL